MTDYGTMQTRIADELHRSDLTSQIKLSIQDAIEHYQEERFWFNEDRSTTFSTVDGQEFYTVTDAANIPLISEIDTARITITTNWNYPLSARTYEQIDMWQSNDNFKAHPTDYARYNKTLRLYPIPNGIYTVRLSGTLIPTTVSDSTSTNFWFTDAERLIRSHAKWDLYMHQIYSEGDAARMERVESRYYAEFASKNTNRLATGRIRPSRF